MHMRVGCVGVVGAVMWAWAQCIGPTPNRGLLTSMPVPVPPAPEPSLHTNALPFVATACNNPRELPTYMI